jgi:CubicO group peptidase (beta-lactamase class C family)
LIGHQGHIVYRRALGYRALEPTKRPMTDDTIFDLASLTKVIATSTAVMQLVDQGRLYVDDQVARYWPAFGRNDKARITVRELLTHYSGLRPDLDLRTQWSGPGAALRRMVGEKPVAPPGTRFLYSDINFEGVGRVGEADLRTAVGCVLRRTHLRAAGHAPHGIQSLTQRA